MYFLCGDMCYSITEGIPEWKSSSCTFSVEICVAVSQRVYLSGKVAHVLSLWRYVLQYHRGYT